MGPGTTSCNECAYCVIPYLVLDRNPKAVTHHRELEVPCCLHLLHNTPKLNEYTDATQIEEPDIAAGSRDLCPHEGLGDRMQSE